MERLSEGAWEIVHPGITQATKAIAEAGQYDDAIFAAFRYVEGEIRERVRKAILAPQAGLHADFERGLAVGSP
jgi:hypothetical protein